MLLINLIKLDHLRQLPQADIIYLDHVAPLGGSCDLNKWYFLDMSTLRTSMRPFKQLGSFLTLGAQILAKI
jgi:hypothetical protein